jgi:hypothetical protein
MDGASPLVAFRAYRLTLLRGRAVPPAHHEEGENEEVWSGSSWTDRGRTSQANKLSNLALEEGSATW